MGTCCHEFGHILSMDHCRKYECLMNGANHLEESDLKPFDLCTNCLPKMAMALNLNE